MIDLLAEIGKSIITTTIDRLLFSSYFGSLVFAISFSILEWGLRRLYKYYATKPLVITSRSSSAKSLPASANVVPRANRPIAIAGALVLTAIFVFTPPAAAFMPSVLSVLLLFAAIAMSFLVAGFQLFGLPEKFDARLKSSILPDWSLYLLFLGLFLLLVSSTWIMVIAKQYPELDMSAPFHLPTNIAEIKSYYVESLIFISVSIVGIGGLIEVKKQKWGSHHGSEIVKVNFVVVIILLCIVPAFILFMAFVFPYW